MEEILKALVSSRQQGNAGQAEDPTMKMVGNVLGAAQNVDLSDGVDSKDVMGFVGGLLGGAQKPQAPQPGVSGIMGALEATMSGQTSAQNDPVMLMLQPFIAPLAKKANISPEIASIVVSFVAHQLLSHHPTSGRDSNHFDLEQLLGQVADGKVDPALLRNSGMVKEISKRTGLNDAAAEQALQTGFTLVGKSAAGLVKKK
ncbi:MAG: hypothetical protein Fur002_20370 [Anaerolineales bacterium]